MTTTDPAPGVPRRSPGLLRYGSRPESGPAWEAAWKRLAEGPCPRHELIAVMRAANPISFRTARELLIHAVASNVIEVAARDRYGRPTLRRPSLPHRTPGATL